MNGCFLLHDAALRVLGRRLLALADHVHTLNDGTLLLSENLEHLASLALILAGQDNHCIVFLNMYLCHYFILFY